MRPATGLISFVGAGPGAADLITLRGAHRLTTADVVVWASSLVPAAVLEHCGEGVEVHDSAGMTLEDVLAVYEAYLDAAIVRLHSGDVSLYSALAEQIAWCAEHERAFEIVPGVGSLAAAASAGVELTVPGVAQSAVLTRLGGGRTVGSMPAGHSVADFAVHGTTMAIYLSAARPATLCAELLAGYPPQTPAIIVAKASWPDETMITTTVDGLADALAGSGIRTVALVLVGPAQEAAAASMTPRTHTAAAADRCLLARQGGPSPPTKEGCRDRRRACSRGGGMVTADVLVPAEAAL
jgi:precorrin-4/cobalt-precorrin-4 C11-methyltransferase